MSRTSAPPGAPDSASGSLRERLASALTRHLRAGDRDAARAVRTALSAIANAEAVPVDDAVDLARRGVTEVGRTVLSAAQDEGLVRAEIADLEAAAATYTDLGDVSRAEQARRGAAALREIVDAAAAPGEYI